MAVQPTQQSAKLSCDCFIMWHVSQQCTVCFHMVVQREVRSVFMGTMFLDTGKTQAHNMPRAAVQMHTSNT